MFFFAAWDLKMLLHEAPEVQYSSLQILGAKRGTRQQEG
jgi:hypothetical protein